MCLLISGNITDLKHNLISDEACFFTCQVSRTVQFYIIPFMVVVASYNQEGTNLQEKLQKIMGLMAG